MRLFVYLAFLIIAHLYMSVSDLKKIAFRVLLLLLLLIIVDNLFGICFSFLKKNAKGGSTENCEYIANKCKEDIIVLGSSRATHHYNPYIISDSLGRSCYNCGEEGNGIILAYGRYKLLTSRYKPQLVIYELTPEYDYLEYEPNVKYLGYLRPYSNNSDIRSLLLTFGGKYEKYLLISNMYRNTSRLLANVLDNITCRPNNQGYSPLYKTMTVSTGSSSIMELPIDSLKLKCFEQLLKDSKIDSVSLVVVVSPIYEDHITNESYDIAKRICNEYDIPFYDFRNMDGITNDASFFQDKRHMNIHGADKYTSSIIKYINIWK